MKRIIYLFSFLFFSFFCVHTSFALEYSVKLGGVTLSKNVVYSSYSGGVLGNIIKSGSIYINSQNNTIEIRELQVETTGSTISYTITQTKEELTKTEDLVPGQNYRFTVRVEDEKGNRDSYTTSNIEFTGIESVYDTGYKLGQIILLFICIYLLRHL